LKLPCLFSPSTTQASEVSVPNAIQSIFRAHFPQYAAGRQLHVREWRAAHALMNCHTAALGGQVLSCPNGHYSLTRYNACRHRSCPDCAQAPRQQWLQRELERLLPCEHFHCVFTLPHEFLALWVYNRVRVNRLLFDCARLSLLELCADERHLGARPGILMALHTWGRTLSQHPHVHCLVSAGGLDEQGRWQHCRPHYLVPVKALAALFRGKLLHQLGQDLADQRLALPPEQDAQHWRAVIRAQYRSHWNVQLSEPYAHGRGVALYLARYAKGGPLSAQRLIRHDAQQVQFTYTDHRDQHTKTLTLSPQEFITRVLWHAPPGHQHMVRHCGLYASAARAQHQRSRTLLSPMVMPAMPSNTLRCVAPAPLIAHNNLLCTQCREPLRPQQSLLPTHRFGENSMASAPTDHLPTGPTGRWTGHSTAQSSGGLRRRSLGRQMPVN
jgi:hypothetical protein